MATSGTEIGNPPSGSANRWKTTQTSSVILSNRSM